MQSFGNIINSSITNAYNNGYAAGAASTQRTQTFELAVYEGDWTRTGTVYMTVVSNSSGISFSFSSNDGLVTNGCIRIAPGGHGFVCP